MQSPRTTLEYDYIILGGGCSGLQLANQIIWKIDETGRSQKEFKILILEARTTYQDDRTWCFWDNGTSPYCKWATNKFDSWSFSTDSQRPFVHKSDNYQYYHLKGIEFYQRSLAMIETSPNLFIKLNQRIRNIKKTKEGFIVRASESLYTGGQIIDCRYSRPSYVSNAVWQTFYGYEIILEKPGRLNHEVVLMGDLRYESSGIFFNYLIPISSKTLLFQTTYIGTRYFLPNELEDEVNLLVNKLFKNKWTIRRTEAGNLLQHGDYRKNNIPDAIKGGSHWGALRASTGYAFSRILQWSSVKANEIVHCKPKIISKPFNKRVQNYMDSVFLNLIRLSPDQVCKTLINFGKNLEPDVFARFMNDSAKVSDFFKIILICPKKAMIKAALNRRFNKS